jgi:hypothetical protein
VNLTTNAAVIEALVSPALFILASASLLATVLLRMSRVVDRVRTIAGRLVEIPTALAIDAMGASLERHRIRARYAMRAIGALYGAVVAFVASCLALAFERLGAGLPMAVAPALAMFGALLLLAAGAWMLAETRLGAREAEEEIAAALRRIEERRNDLPVA